MKGWMDRAINYSNNVRMCDKLPDNERKRAIDLTTRAYDVVFRRLMMKECVREYALYGR